MRRLANSAASDTWCIQTSPVWIDMIGDTAGGGHYARPMPLLCDVAWKLWALPGMVQGAVRSPELHILAEPQASIRVALDHFQYIQLMRVVDALSNWLDTIESDREFFARQQKRQTTRTDGADIKMDTPRSMASLALVCTVDRIQLNLLLPVDAPPSPYATVASVPSRSTSSIDVPQIAGMWCFLCDFIVDMRHLGAYWLLPSSSSKHSFTQPIFFELRDD
jgi:hypothetical protein